jgi:glucose/arabinose dehydrogenase
VVASNLPSAGAAAPTAADILLSKNRPVKSSSDGGSSYVAKNAVDGPTTTRWASARKADPQWIYVDIGAPAHIGRVNLGWDASCAKAYKIETSTDAKAWKAIYETTTGDGGTDDIDVSGDGRYVRVLGTVRCRPAEGYSLRQFDVYGTTDMAAPSAPKNLRSTGVTSNTADLAWDAPTDNVGVAAYDIYHDGNKLAEADGKATKATVEDLTPNTTYRFSVFARDGAGNTSPTSNLVTVTTPKSSDAEKPSAPSGLKVTGTTASSISLSWTASTDNVKVTAYDVFNGGSVLKPGVNGTSTTVESLASNTSFTLTVKAKDAAGNVSAASNSVTAKTNGGGGGGAPSSISTVSEKWTIPWGMTWLPDNKTALIGERDSFKVFAATLDGKKTEIGTVPNVVTTGGEGGLLGLAVSRQNDQDVFIYHTAADGNRIAKMTYKDGKLDGYTELVTGIRKNRFHNGGRIAFGPDGYLYATTGDAQQENLAQDKNSLNGKILRMTTAGKPAPGNPFGSLVYSYGHRNPQGLAWDSAGRLWEAEFGNSKADELNLIKPGLNYGWPTCEGDCNTSGMTNPKRTWGVSEASPSAIAVVNDVVYMAALRGQRLWRIPLAGENAGAPQAYYVSQYGRMRTVMKVPGANALWLSTTNSDNNGRKPPGSDKIFRVEIS